MSESTAVQQMLFDALEGKIRKKVKYVTYLRTQEALAADQVVEMLDELLAMQMPADAVVALVNKTIPYDAKREQ